jgi:hypothetical protein
MAVWLLGVPAIITIVVRACNVGSTSTGSGILLIGFLVNPPGSAFFPLGFVVPTLWSVFLLYWAVRCLRRAPTSPSWHVGWLVVWLRAFRKRLRAEANELLAPTLDQPEFAGFRVRNPLWRRARLHRVYDSAGFVELIQWAGWITIYLFILLLMVYGRRPYLDEQSTLLFLVPLWIGVLLLTAMLAATSLVGDRRRGLLDLVLLTPLKPKRILDGTLFALWEHLRSSFFLVWLIAFYFSLAKLPGLVPCLCSALTASLLCALVLLYGSFFHLLRAQHQERYWQHSAFPC